MMLRICALLGCCMTAHAQMDVAINELGGVDRLMIGERVVGQDVHVRIVKPGWNGDWGAQREGGGLTLDELPAEDPRSAVGRFDCEGKPCEFEVRIERGTPEDDWLRLSCKLTPSADLDTELIVVMVDLPVEGNAGKGQFLICDGEAIGRRPLPAELPDPYHIASEPQLEWFGWLLPGDVGLRVQPDGKGITGVSFQDNRQFNMGVFQAQFGVRDSKGLKAGTTYEFGLTLRPLSQAALEAEKKRIVDLAEARAVDMTSRKPLALRGLRLNSTRVPRYEKLEIDLDLDATFDNPFDPGDIDVMATFTGPGGRVMEVPGFFWQDYERMEFGGKWRLEPVGEPGWKVRFAAPEPGDWQVVVSARDRSGEARSEAIRFTCVTGEERGYVRRCPDTEYYLQFDNGAPYFAIGENICWPPQGKTGQYEEWFSALGAAGGNYCRIWLVRWNMALEWTNQGGRNGYYYGLGKYSPDNAWRLDWVMEQARRNGVYCMLALGYHGELMDRPDYFNTNCWQWNPYNQVNGGPCERPQDFWVDETARKLYKQRLRYYIARWGWDAHVLSWEFWNEVRAPAPWVDEMAKFFEANDPYAHLVTTTYGYDEVWRIPELDYTQAHTYGSDENRPSTTPFIAKLGRTYTSKWPKPFMVGEFGIDWKASDSKHDPEGIGTSLHNGLWASVMTRSFGTAALWYWDGYVHPKNMYREFTSIKRFTDTVPWTELRPELAEFGPVTVPVPDDAPWGDVRVKGGLGWAKATGTDFTANPDGSLSGEEAFCTILFSDSKRDLKAPLRFHVSYPTGGKFVLHVDTVSASATLRVRVDGEEVWTKDLPAGEGEGEWKSTKFYEQWGIWQSVYDKDFEVPIPAGEHVIEIENTGSDWVSVPYYVFAGCRDPKFAELDLYGLRTDDFAILWLHDQESTWFNDKEGKEPREISGASTTLLGLSDGEYRIEWWDTRKGEVIATAEARCEGGQLPLEAPNFRRDIAGKVAAVR